MPVSVSERLSNPAFRFCFHWDALSRIVAALHGETSLFDAGAMQLLLTLSKRLYQLQWDVDDDNSMVFQPFALKLGQ